MSQLKAKLVLKSKISLSEELEETLKTSIRATLSAKKCLLIELLCDNQTVEVVFDYSPQVQVAFLIRSMKAAAAKRAKTRIWDESFTYQLHSLNAHE